jgi:hypothetical protein
MEILTLQPVTLSVSVISFQIPPPVFGSFIVITLPPQYEYDVIVAFGFNEVDKFV